MRFETSIFENRLQSDFHEILSFNQEDKLMTISRKKMDALAWILLEEQYEKIYPEKAGSPEEMAEGVKELLEKVFNLIEEKTGYKESSTSEDYICFDGEEEGREMDENEMIEIVKESFSESVEGIFDQQLEIAA